MSGRITNYCFGKRINHHFNARITGDLIPEPTPHLQLFLVATTDIFSVEILLYMGMSTGPVVHTVYTSYGQVEQSIELMNSSTLRSSYTPSWR